MPLQWISALPCCKLVPSTHLPGVHLASSLLLRGLQELHFRLAVVVSLVIRSVRRGGIICWLFLISCNALPLSSIDAASLRACSQASSSFLRNSIKLRDLGQTWRARPFPGPSQLPNSAKHSRVRPQRTASSRGVSDRSACDVVLVRSEWPNVRPSPRFAIS